MTTYALVIRTNRANVYLCIVLPTGPQPVIELLAIVITFDMHCLAPLSRESPFRFNNIMVLVSQASLFYLQSSGRSHLGETCNIVTKMSTRVLQKARTEDRNPCCKPCNDRIQLGKKNASSTKKRRRASWRWGRG